MYLQPTKADSPKDVLVIQGKILDSSGSALSDANILPYLNGKPFLAAGHGAEAEKDYTTGKNGLFRVEIPTTEDKIKSGKWELKVTRPSFKPSQLTTLKISDGGVSEDGARISVANASVQLKRFQGSAFWIALIVFVAVYVLIAFEILHRTLAAFLGAALVLLITHTVGHFDEAYNILTWEQALHSVDWNVIFLLMGMMIIVGVLKGSGVFQWLAYKSFQVAQRSNIYTGLRAMRCNSLLQRLFGQCHDDAAANSGNSGNRSGAQSFAVCVSDAGDTCFELWWHCNTDR